ncbi:hypothetical protein L3N51_02265 [Metallosphaera sp. J1]|nr:hypothetical protein [Metallosphaera javensis (ex Hofmann et al. 2022)]
MATFTRNRALIVTGTLIGLFNPGTLSVIIGSPTTLYVAPIPWFLAYYYRYRIKGEGKLIYSLIPLTFLGVYGPSIPSLILSILSVEIFRVISRPRSGSSFSRSKRSVLKGFLTPSIVLIFFSLIHVNSIYLVLTHGSAYYAFSYIATRVAESKPNFNMLEILGTQVAPNYFTQIYPNSELISLSLVIIAALGLLYLVKRKIYFPLIFAILLFALVSYNQDYLGLYSLIHSTVFSGVDPYEYNPMASILVSMIIANLSRNSLSRILWTSSLLLVMITISLGYSIFASIWHPINLPQGMVEAYRELYNGSEGETVFIFPPSLRLYTPEYKPLGNIPIRPPPQFFWNPGGSLVVDQVPATGSNPYTSLYVATDLYNTSEILRLSQELGIVKFLIENPTAFFGSAIYYSTPGNYSQSILLALDGYIFYVPNSENLSNVTIQYRYNYLSVVKLNISPDYKVKPLWYGIEIIPLKNETRIITPVGYGTGSFSTYETMNYYGQVEVSSIRALKPFVITSSYVVVNWLSNIAIISSWIYFLIPLLQSLKRTLAKGYTSSLFKASFLSRRKLVENVFS